MPTRLELDLTSALRRPPARRRDNEAPLRLLLCGDFSGRAGRGLDDPAALASRALLRVDVDNLDMTIARLAPVVAHVADGKPVEIGFATLDDFHPDQLYAHSGLFDDLRALRERLSDPAQFAQAKTEVMGAEAESDEATLSRLLGRSSEQGTPSTASATAVPRGVEAAVDALIRRAVTADAAPSVAPQQAQYLSGVDAAITERMRELLHDPGFQALEAAWRTVQFLVRRLELDEGIELHLLDVTRAELAATAAEPELERSGLWKTLVERRRDPDGGPSWSMVVALEAFDASKADVALLATLAATAAAGGAPLVATASPRLLGCTTLSGNADPDDWEPLDADSQARWQALRRSPLAPWIGLVAPALLLRLPYGGGNDPLERFDFDEMAGVDPACGLLWGQPGVACALLAGLAFTDAGWQMDLDAALDIDDLPAWIYDDGGDRHLYPCAGAWIGERAAQAMLSRGMMPLLSRRDYPAIRLLRWQSIAEPATTLSGPWET